ncbi:MAG: DotA/TraY family protein, partial [Gammaproteobacteria bacterium]|nr:DotA/TraY family protein [Gammaproteobacteria bacterium]
TIGAIFGVYMPLIPYTLFSLGAISWMIVVIEAMVAGPIIAIGLLSPGGQNEIFSRAEPAIFMTLSIMLRPTLMLFGMFSAMLLAGVVVTFINAAFFSVVNSFNPSGFTGMFETFLYILAYAGLIMTSLNKCFELIYHVPDRVLHWIGQQGTGATSDQQALSEVKAKVGGGADVGAGAGKAVGGQFAGQASQSADAFKTGGLTSAERKTEHKDKQEHLAKSPNKPKI